MVMWMGKGNKHSLISRMFFTLEPETAHEMAIKGMNLARVSRVSSLMGLSYRIRSPSLQQTIHGIRFENPVGLACFDKNARFIDGAYALGFGFTEIGGVTPLAQPGNPKPRLFRFPKHSSLQNALGFANDGMEVITGRLEDNHPARLPIGINIAKNKVTPNEDAKSDYLKVIKHIHGYADYLTINVSSPNTLGIRELQNETFLKDVFKSARQITTLPLFLKISPDMTPEYAIEICDAAIKGGASGIVATNTSIDYSLLPNAKNFGGISGQALKFKSAKLFKAIAKELYGRTTLISVGGVDSGQEAYYRIRHGASLVELITAFIYNGPSTAKRINKDLLKLMKNDGYRNISEAVGSAL
jgi:dihydroorotate dehydrogenase